MKNYLGALAVAGLLSGCQPILRTALGMKTPRPQADAAVQAYAATYYPTLPVYRPDTAAYRRLLRSTYKPGWEPGFRPLQFLCFAPDGRLAAQWASCEGNLPATLTGFPPHNQTPSDSSLTFAYAVAGLRPLGGAAADAGPALRPTGYTYLVYWTTWLHRQSRQLVGSVAQYARQHGDAQPAILLVNVDEHPRQAEQAP